MKTLKVIKILFLVLILFFVLIISSFSVQKGWMEQIIINPLKVKVASNSIILKVSSKKDFQTNINQRFKEFKNYGSDGGFISSNYCIVGGQYKLNISVFPIHDKNFNNSIGLFYCKTTQDLINQIKIPSTWSKNNLILYCNDGLEINSRANNFDFLLSKLDTYKSCLLKNIDLGKTILYGYEGGNFTIDSDETLFFNSSTHKGRILDSNFKFVKQISSNVFLYTDLKDKSSNNKYYFGYDQKNHFYSLSKIKPSLFNLPLKNIFTYDIGLSRLVLDKHFTSNNKNIYGYETAYNIETKSGDQKILPIYKIKYGTTISLDPNACVEALKPYNSVLKLNGETLQSNDFVTCGGSGNNREIMINSQNLDGENYGTKNVDSFNLFKNIILDLN